jgi:hypothetical protein
MKTLDDLKVGDVVWYSDVNRKGLTEGRVSKVGRKLVTVGYYVFRKDTGRTNNEYGHQLLIPDLEAHKERIARSKCWLRIRDARGLSDDVSLADVKAAAALLRIPLDEQ